jgi:acetyl esterase/lipase
VLLSGTYVRRVLGARADFAAAFGSDWRTRIPPGLERRMLRRRWSVGLPKASPPRWERDVVYWTLPGGANGDGGRRRPLLCDLWRPRAGTPPSGLALVYLHGSAWHYSDKDRGTRAAFRHLAAQGHVIVDVAYRLCPETDWRGMLHDAQRAIAWTKQNGPRYGVDPARVVVGGGSAGGHLALLAAYTADRPDLAPPELNSQGAGADLRVRGAISWYGPTDLIASYTRAERVADSRTASGVHGLRVRLLCGLLGGTLEEVPEAYRAASPLYHVHPGCPPTLLLHGAHDSIVAPVASAVLARKLAAAGVPVLHVAYPQTEHGFDLVLPRVSPVARAALYAVERFLALLAWD